MAIWLKLNEDLSIDNTPDDLLNYVKIIEAHNKTYLSLRVEINSKIVSDDVEATEEQKKAYAESGGNAANIIPGESRFTEVRLKRETDGKTPCLIKILIRTDPKLPRTGRGLELDAVNVERKS